MSPTQTPSSTCTFAQGLEITPNFAQNRSGVAVIGALPFWMRVGGQSIQYRPPTAQILNSAGPLRVTATDDRPTRARARSTSTWSEPIPNDWRWERWRSKNPLPFACRGLILRMRTGMLPGGSVMAGFVQVIELQTTKVDEIEVLLAAWLAQTEGTRKSQRGTLTRDRDRSDVYVQIVEFPSYEEAMANSQLPATAEFAKKMAELCDAAPTFRNLDVIRVEEM